MRIYPQALKAWLAGRPEIVKQTARRYPLGTAFDIHDQMMYVTSYYEDGGVSVSPFHLAEDYDKAMANRQPICGCCVGRLDELRVEEKK